MTAMINGYPTEEDLRNRIVRQLGWRQTEPAALLWRGYLYGLLEWGLIELDVYDRLLKILPKVGSKELYEIAVDEPISREREAEIDEFLRSEARKG